MGASLRAQLESLQAAQAAREADPGVVIPMPEAHPEREARISEEIERQRVIREARRRLAAEEGGPSPPPEIVTLAALLAEPDPPVTWRIHGWQPVETRVMLAAARKSGKTTLSGSLVRSLVDGDAWLGRDAVVPIAGTVAIIDTEMSRGQLRAWLRAQRIRHAERVLVVPLRGQASTIDLCDGETRARWAAWLRAHAVRYLVVDCLRPILDAIGLDESRESGRYLVALDGLLRDAGIPEACVVHHMGHTGERSRGDSRLRDWPDVEWRLVREDADDDASPRYLSAYGRDVDQPEARLEYDPLGRRLTVAGGTRQDARVEGALAVVLDVLAASTEALSARAIERALDETDHGRAAIRAAIRAGVEAGRITTETGPRRAILHRAASQCAGVRRECASAPASECASAYIDTRTGAHSTDGDGMTAPAAHSSPDPQSRPGGRHGRY